MHAAIASKLLGKLRWRLAPLHRSEVQPMERRTKMHLLWFLPRTIAVPRRTVIVRSLGRLTLVLLLQML